MLNESDIQKQIIDYLSIRAVEGNFFFFSIPNEGLMLAAIIAKLDDKTKAILSVHLKKMGLVTGTPDLCILYNEKIEIHPYPPIYKNIQKTLFIEVKTKEGRLSTIQEIIHKKIESVRHTVEVARSLDDVIEILKKYKVV